MSRTDKLLICVGVACIILALASLGNLVDTSVAPPSEEGSASEARACGLKVRADPVLVKGMRKDCGIFGPRAAEK